MRCLPAAALVAALAAGCDREPPAASVPRPPSWERAADAPVPEPVRRVRALVEAETVDGDALRALTNELFDAAARRSDDRAVGEALARAVVAVLSLGLDDDHLPPAADLLAAARRADERCDLPLLRGALDTVECYLLAGLPPAERLPRARAILAGIEARPLAQRNPCAESEALLLYADTCAELWRFDEAWRAIDAMQRLCASFPFPDGKPFRAHETRANLHRARFRLLLRYGIVDRAAAQLQAQEDELRAARDAGGAWPGDALLADRIAFFLGTEQFAAAVRAVPAATADPLLLLARGIALAELGRHDEAETALALAQSTDPGLGGADWAKAQGQRIASALALGDVARADRLERAARELLAGHDGLDQLAMLGSLRLQVRERQGAPDAELAQCRTELQAVFDALLAALDATEPRPGGLGFLHFDEWSEVAVDLVALALRLDGDAGGEHALDVVLAAQARATLARRLGAPAVGWRALRGALPAGTGVLVLLPGKRRSFALAADGGGTVTAAPLPPRAELEAGVAALRRLQADPPAGDVVPDELAAVARQWLPPPIAERLTSWRAVVVATSGALEDVALELLPLADGRLLGEALAVADLPALPLLPVLARRPRAAPGRVCLVAHLAPSAQAQALMGAPVAAVAVPDADVAALLAPFAGDGCEVVRTPDATPEAWVARDLSRFALVHVLAHGVYDPFRERGAGLALADGGGDGGVLTCDAVEANRSLRGVVVLSACGAARGPRRRGEGSLAHLGGAMLFAGAPAVVLSRGDLRYRDTVALMAALHRELAAGSGVAEALRRARTAVPNARWMAAQVQVLGAGW